MKSYETPTRMTLPPRTYTIIRVDGRAFHTHLRTAEKPFDEWVIHAMDRTAAALCREISGARFAYTQSDEISILLTDLEPQSQPWFGGGVQKMASVAASIATAAFNDIYRRVQKPDRVPDGHATFDGRAYTIPSRIEVANYFLWRQKDAIRNAVSMAAQAFIPHKDLQGVSVAGMQELLYQRRTLNFKTDFSDRERRGGVAVRENFEVKTADIQHLISRSYGHTDREPQPKVVTRSRWAAQDAPDFTLDNGGFLAVQVPQEPADALQPAIPECRGSMSGNCLAESQGDTACATEDNECIHEGQR
jgi:tRNA(His) 5'-end guanylyltransferase